MKIMKKFKLCDVSSVEDDRVKEIDWDQCILCQKDTDEDLTFPDRSLRADKNLGYSKLAENLEEFKKLGRVPPDVNVSALNDGAGLMETFVARGQSGIKLVILILAAVGAVGLSEPRRGQAPMLLIQALLHCFSCQDSHEKGIIFS